SPPEPAGRGWRGRRASTVQALVHDIIASLSTAVVGAIRLRNDAAVMAPGDGRSFVVTVRTLMADVQLLDGDPADLVARNALRVNLSDLAAKGADPAYYLVALSVGDGHGRDWIERFPAGLSEDQDIYGCRLAGGDTTRTPGPTVVTITALGNVP